MRPPGQFRRQGWLPGQCPGPGGRGFAATSLSPEYINDNSSWETPNCLNSSKYLQGAYTAEQREWRFQSEFPQIPKHRSQLHLTELFQFS